MVAYRYVYEGTHCIVFVRCSNMLRMLLRSAFAGPRAYSTQLPDKKPGVASLASGHTSHFTHS